MKRKIAFALILIFVLLTVGLVACTPTAVAIEKVELTATPQTVYEMGDSINFGDAKLMVYYKNGASQIVDIAEKATVSGFYRNVAGEQIITVRYAEEYSYGETAFVVTVNRPKTVLSKTVVFPTVDYVEGQRINFDGAYATVVYDKQYDGVNITERFQLTADNLISGGTSAAGKQTLEFLLYNDGEKDVTVSQEINVFDSVVRSVSLATLDAAPTKTAYALGEKLDLSGLQLRLFMNTEINSAVDTVIKTADGGFTLRNHGGTVTAFDADGNEFDTSYVNTASLYISYRETETSDVLRTSGMITVRAVERMPSTDSEELPTYDPGVPTQVVNRQLEFGSTVMTVTFNDQTKVRYNLGDFDPTVSNQHRTTGFDVRGFDINVSGQQTLEVVLYKPLEDGEGYSDETYGIFYTLVVNVAAERVEAISIEDTRSAAPEEYESYVVEEDGEYYFRGYVGDVLDLADLSFKLVYNSGKTETAALSDIAVQGFGTNVTTVTAGRVFRLEEKGDDGYITFDTNGVSARINVVSRGLAFKELSLTAPSKLQYTHGENFSISGAELAVYYSDEESADGIAVRVKRVAESELLPLIDLSSFDTSVSGEIRLTVSYSDGYVDLATVEFSVWVVTTVVNLEIATAPVKSAVNGSSFDRTGSGLVVRQLFSDGSAAVEISDFSDAAWTFSPSTLTLDDSSALRGTVEVTVSYQGASAKFNVTVTNYYREITEVEFIGADSEKSFKVTEGMAIDLSLYRFKVLREDGTFAFVTANGSDYNAENMTVGTRRVSLYYENTENTPERLSFSENFEVVAKQVDRYVVLGSVEHIHTKADAAFISDGLTVRRYFDNGSYEVLTIGSEILFDGYSLDGLTDADFPAVLDITLKLPNGDIIDEFEFGGSLVSSIEITVYEKFAVSAVFGDASGQEISVPNLTLKQSSYLNGENGLLMSSSAVTGAGAAYDEWRDALDVLNDAYVVVTYTTGATDIIAVKDGGFKVVGFEPMRTGTQAVSLVYAADENIKVNFFVSVAAREVLSVEWADGASIGAVKEGKALDQKLLLNAKLRITYDFGEPSAVTATADMIRDGGKVFDPADYVGKFGNDSSISVNVKASYNGIETADTLNLTVERKRLTKIDIFGSPKTQYFEGEEFNFGATDFLKSSDGSEDLYLILYYDNDTRVADSVKIDMSMVDFSAYDNAEMTGQPKAQRILLSYTDPVDGGVFSYSYNVAMNDRANATVRYNPNNVYVYVYGERTNIDFDIIYNGVAAEYADDDVTVSFENELYSYVIAANGYIRTPINGGDGVEVGYLPAGNYTVKISYAGRAHTADTVGLNAFVDNSRLVIVERKQLEVSFDGRIGDERVYAADMSYDRGFFIGLKSFSGFVDGEDEDVLRGVPSVYVNGVLLIETVKKAGSYTVRLGGYEADNYSIVYIDASFNISQREIYIALKDGGKITVVYGASDIGLSERNGYFTVVDANGDALDIGETLDGELLRNQEGVNSDGAEVRGNKVGRYGIGLGTVPMLNPDYIIAIYGDGEPVFEIIKRDLTVTANDVDAVYGTDGIRLSVTFGQFYENDTAATALSGSPEYCIDGEPVNGGIVGMEDVGTYILSVDGFDAENYNLIYETGTYIVSPKAVTVHPLSSQGKIYGDEDGIFRYSVSGLVGDDVLSGALERDGGENVGSYAFRLGTLTNDNNPNYELSLADNAPEFVISEKPITVVLGNLSKQYDGLTAAQANALTRTNYDADGNVYDKEEINYDLSFLNAAAGIGNYTITLTDRDGNHAITLADSYSYSITPRKITVEFLTKLENETEWMAFTSDSSFDYEYEYSRQMTVRYKLLPEDIGNEQLENTIARDNPVIYPTVSSGFTYENGWYLIKNNGRWNINVNTVADNNYTIDATSATLNINKLELSVYATAAALTATYTAGEQLAVRDYDVRAARNITENEKSYIKSILSLRVGGGGRQDVVENGYVVMFVLPTDANYTAIADSSVEPYSVSDYVNDHGGYDEAEDALRFIVNKRTVKVTIGEAYRTKRYDAQEAAVAAERLVLDIDDAALRTAVSGALVYERLTTPEGASGSLDAYATSDSGTFSIKLDNAKMANGNYNAFFERNAYGLIKNPENADGEYDKDDYYVYTIEKNTATVEVALSNGVRGRQFNGRALRSSDVAVNISGYYPSTLSVSEILARTGLTFGFSPVNGADENLINVGDYLVEIDDYSDYNHAFALSATYRTFSITRLTVNVTVWDMYKRYDGTETDNTFRLMTEHGEEISIPVDDYTKGFDIGAQIYDNGVLRDLTADDLPNCSIRKSEGVDSGRYRYEILFPEEEYPNYNFRISTTRDYEIKRAQITLGIGDENSTYGTSFDGVFDIEQFGSYIVEDAVRLQSLISFRYTDEDGNPVALNPSTPSGRYRVYPVTTAAEAVYGNYEFAVSDNHFDETVGGYGYLTVLKAELTVTLSDFGWEYRREFVGQDEADGNFAGLNMPEMFSFSFPADFELSGIDVTLIDGFVYPRFTQAFYDAFQAITDGAVGAKLNLTSSSFVTETATDAANADYYFTIGNDARVSVSPAPLTVETVRVTMDGNAVNQVSGTIDKVYGEVPTAEEIGIRYNGFRGEEFDGALWFNGNWYVIIGGAYIAATAEQQSKIIGGADALIENRAELPKFFDIKQVDVYGYVTETIGETSYKQWKKIGWEPRVELIYGYQSAGNRLAADVRSFSSPNYSAVADPTFIYIVTRRALTATLSASEAMEASGELTFKRTYDDHLKVGEDYNIAYDGLVNIPNITVENEFDEYFAAKPSVKPETDGVWAWSGSAWILVSSSDRYVYDYENGGFDKYYFVKDGENEYLYYIDNGGEFHSLTATAAVAERPQTLFYDAAPTREWFNLTDSTNKVNSRPGHQAPVSVELSGLYNNNYDITFAKKNNNNYQLAIYNRIDYIMVGDSTVFATLVAENGENSFIPIKVYYVDGTSSGVIKYYPRKDEQSDEYAKRIVIGDNGEYEYDQTKTGNQTLKVTYSEDNPLMENGLDVEETYIVVRSYPSAPGTETGAAANYGGGQYTFGGNSWLKIGGRTEFNQIFAQGAYDRVDMEFALKHSSQGKGVFETVVFDDGSRKLALKVKSGAYERYKLYVAETVGNVETEWEYHTYNMTESVYIDLFDGRAHLYTAYVNRLSHELTLVIDNSIIIRHSLRDETNIDAVTGLADIRFELEEQQGTFSNLNSQVAVWFAVENLEFNVISFKATRVGYENEMGISVLPNESASETMYITDDEPTATVFTKSAFFTVYGSYTDGTRVDYFINGKPVSRDSLSEELPEGLYRLTAKVVDAEQPEKVFSEAHFDLRIMKRAYSDGFQSDVGTPTAGSPVTLKTDGLNFNRSDASNAAEELKKIDMYREHGVQVGRYYALLSEIGGVKYFSIVNNVRDDDGNYWSGAVNYKEYDGTANLSLGGSDISLSANGISSLTVDRRTAVITVTYTAADGSTVTDSAAMNSVGTFYSGNVAEYGYYKLTFGIDKDAAATVDTSNEYAAVINLKSNDLTTNAFAATDSAYVGLSLGIRFTDGGACETELLLKSEGAVIGRSSTTAIDWLTETEEKFTVEGYFDGTNSKITVNVYLGDDLKHTFEIKRSSFTHSIDQVGIENEDTIQGWDRNNTLIKQFATVEGGQSINLNGATLTVYGVEIGASAPVRRALYSLRREGGSGSSAETASAPHSTEIPFTLQSESSEVLAAMLSGGINGGYGESYNSYAVRFAFTPNGSIDRKIRFILAENTTTDLTSQINAYQNEENFTSTRAIALEYVDNGGGSAEMWFTFMVAGQTNVYRQLVYSINDENDWRFLSDGEVHTVAVNFYKGARELSNNDLVSRNVSSQNIDLYIDGVLYKVDGEGEYDANGTVKRFYYPNYNTLVSWKSVSGATSGSSTINLADKYFLNEYTSAGVAVTYGELKLYDMYVAKTAVDVAGGEAYFAEYGGLGAFFKS